MDLVPDIKYCMTQKWPLPKNQCEVIDELGCRGYGAKRFNISAPSPTFCVKKPNGKWRIFHAYNKLNAATIPVQTPISRKDVL